MGAELPKMMQRIHGSVAKLVNDHLRSKGSKAPWLAEGASAPGSNPTPRNPTKTQPTNPGAKAPSAKQSGGNAGGKFWGDKTGHEYFDGCLRSVKQGRLTYRYILTQSKRHGVCNDYKQYPHTRINVECDRAIKRAVELNAFLTGVPYKRYQKPK